MVNCFDMRNDKTNTKKGFPNHSENPLSLHSLIYSTKTIIDFYSQLQVYLFRGNILPIPF
jgi:hypothetical protein